MKISKIIEAITIGRLVLAAVVAALIAAGILGPEWAAMLGDPATQ